MFPKHDQKKNHYAFAPPHPFPRKIRSFSTQNDRLPEKSGTIAPNAVASLAFSLHCVSVAGLLWGFAPFIQPHALLTVKILPDGTYLELLPGKEKSLLVRWNSSPWVLLDELLHALDGICFPDVLCEAQDTRRNMLIKIVHCIQPFRHDTEAFEGFHFVFRDNRALDPRKLFLDKA